MSKPNLGPNPDVSNMDVRQDSCVSRFAAQSPEDVARSIVDVALENLPDVTTGNETFSLGILLIRP